MGHLIAFNGFDYDVSDAIFVNMLVKFDGSSKVIGHIDELIFIIGVVATFHNRSTTLTLLRSSVMVRGDIHAVVAAAELHIAEHLGRASCQG